MTGKARVYRGKVADMSVWKLFTQTGDMIRLVVCRKEWIESASDLHGHSWRICYLDSRDGMVHGTPEALFLSQCACMGSYEEVKALNEPLWVGWLIQVGNALGKLNYSREVELKASADRILNFQNYKERDLAL